jgi:hypothetical protein
MWREEGGKRERKREREERGEEAHDLTYIQAPDSRKLVSRYTA